MPRKRIIKAGRVFKKTGRPPKDATIRQRDIFHFRTTEHEGRIIRKSLPPDKTMSEHLRDTVISSIEEK